MDKTQNNSRKDKILKGKRGRSEYQEEWRLEVFVVSRSENTGKSKTNIPQCVCAWLARNCNHVDVEKVGGFKHEIKNTVLA